MPAIFGTGFHHQVHRKLSFEHVLYRFLKGKTPYAMSKVAATVLVHGLANELVGSGQYLRKCFLFKLKNYLL